MIPAPVVLIAYRRADHLGRTIDALRANDLASETDLFVYSDGARSAADAPEVERVRALARSIDGFRSVQVVERARNLGLGGNVVGAVTETLERHERVVVVEDDLVTSPYFMRFINDGLECYAGDEDVASVHGYMYPVEDDLPETFFLRGADCWGWGTWRRAWRRYEPDGRKLREELRRRRLERAFDLEGARRLVRMLDGQIAGRNDSWAVRWHAAAFLAGMLTLYPDRSLVDNIGNDTSGTHRAASQAFRVRVADRPVPVARRPVEEHAGARRAVEAYFRAQQRISGRRIGDMARRLAALIRS